MVEFLRARLAEDLDAAVRAVPGPWQVDPDNPERVIVADRNINPELNEIAWLRDMEIRATGRHIARQDPARVLVQVGATRRIIDLHEREHLCSVFESAHINRRDWIFEDDEDGCSTLRLLALPYAAHPDYRAEWRDHTGG